VHVLEAIYKPRKNCDRQYPDKKGVKQLAIQNVSLHAQHMLGTGLN